MAMSDARPEPQAEGKAGPARQTASGQAAANAPQMEAQSVPASVQQGSAALRDWASI